MHGNNGRQERLKSIRALMDESSEVKHGRRITDGHGFQVHGDKNVYAQNVFYQFSPVGHSAMKPERSFRGVDWSAAPKLAHWWAIDKNGVAHWYCRPNVAAFTEFWYSESLLAPDFGYEGDWRDSLASRPAQPKTGDK